MIEVTNIFAGWLTFQIHYGYTTLQFTDSYLDDFREEMDYLLGISRNGQNDEFIYDFQYGIISRAICLDGEGTLLKLSIIKYEYEDEIVLTWWLNDEIPVSMVFNYNQLIQSYCNEMNRVEQEYDEKFLMENEEEGDENE